MDGFNHTSTRAVDVTDAEEKEIDVFLGKAHAAAPGMELPEDPFAAPASEIHELSGLGQSAKRRITNKMQKAAAAGAEGTGSKSQTEAEPYDGYDALGVVSPPHNLDYLAKLPDINSSHYAAIKAKVSNIVSLGYNLVESPKSKAFREEISGEKKKKDKYDKFLRKTKDDIAGIIEGWNKNDSLVETLSNVWTDYETTGNGYIEVGRIKTGPNKGKVGYVGHIPATTMRIRRKRDGFVQIVSDKAEFFRNFGEDTVNPIAGGSSTPNEVIHIKKYAPSSGYYGVPDIISALSALTGNELASRYNLDFFENKAMPRHVVIIKGAALSTSGQRAVSEFFETGLKGKNHRSLVVPLPADTNTEKVDFKIEAVEAGIQESSFEKYKKSCLADILMAHRVPITKVGTPEGVNLAIARDADKTFKEQVCGPEQKKLEKKVNKLVKDFTDVFQIKFNELTLTDADTQSKIDERRVKNHIEVPNEVRARDGLPAIEGGDKPLDLKPQQAADARAQGNRQRDADRSAGATDSAGEARSPKGEGRTQA